MLDSLQIIIKLIAAETLLCLGLLSRHTVLVKFDSCVVLCGNKKEAAADGAVYSKRNCDPDLLLLPEVLVAEKSWQSDNYRLTVSLPATCPIRHPFFHEQCAL